MSPEPNTVVRKLDDLLTDLDRIAADGFDHVQDAAATLRDLRRGLIGITVPETTEGGL